MPSNDQPSVDGPASMVKALPTLGHAVVDWWEHGAAIVKDLAKHPERSPTLAALVAEAAKVTPSALLTESSQTLELEVSWGAGDAWWITRVKSAAQDEMLLQCWLLHLPALRQQWEKRMRSARLELLHRIVPRAWLPQPPTALPPGSVIAGLGVTTWEDAETLPHLRHDMSGLLYEIKPATQHRSSRYRRSATGRVEQY